MDVQAMSESLNVLDLKDKTADYKKLIDYGLDSKVADKLDDIYKVRHRQYLMIFISNSQAKKNIKKVIILSALALSTMYRMYGVVSAYSKIYIPI